MFVVLLFFLWPLNSWDYQWNLSFSPSKCSSVLPIPQSGRGRPGHLQNSHRAEPTLSHAGEGKRPSFDYLICDYKLPGRSKDGLRWISINKCMKNLTEMFRNHGFGRYLHIFPTTVHRFGKHFNEIGIGKDEKDGTPWVGLGFYQIPWQPFFKFPR